MALICFLLFSFTGECNHPEAIIRSCQEPGNQFLIANQKFTINYKKCEGIKDSFEGGMSTLPRAVMILFTVTTVTLDIHIVNLLAIFSW